MSGSADAPTRRVRPVLDGILVVAKPPGPTSHDIVALVRRLTGVRRVGHGGTLDPFASGVLPVFLGFATRMVEYHMGDDKAYRATVAFGARSSTDDLEGDLVPGAGPAPDREALEATLAGFRGPIEQVPPDHSAVHVSGRRAYELARDGAKPELRPRSVTIHALGVAEFDGSDPARPTAVLDVRCSAGTYVRALARDLGEALGCGAYLAALVRTASGPFVLEGAHTLDAVREALASGRARGLLIAPDAGLDDIARLTLGPVEVAALARGQVVRARGGPGGDSDAPGAGREAVEPSRLPTAHARARSPELRRVFDERGTLVAMARLVGGRVYPDKVFIEP